MLSKDAGSLPVNIFGRLMKRFTATSLIIGTIIVALTGCGSSEDATSETAAPAVVEGEVAGEDETPAGNSGSYSTKVNDGVLDIALPAPAADPTVAGITQYAAAVGFTGPMSFLNQTLTNQGDSAMAMCAPNVVTSSGETIAFTSAMQFIGDLQDLVPQGETALYNQGVELYNSILNSDTALPGAKTTGTYITTSDVSAFERMFSGAFTMETMGQGCDTEFTAQ